MTFLFMFHYGFLPDSEVPSGRINPYLGVGPAIVWTSVQGTLPTAFSTEVMDSIPRILAMIP